jgi:hypothetical protein
VCVAKKPQISQAAQDKDKSLPILRNPYLDGLLGNIAALRNGTSAFRIDLANPLAIPVGTGAGATFAGGGGSGGGGTVTSPSGGGSTGGSGTSGSGGASRFEVQR